MRREAKAQNAIRHGQLVTPELSAASCSTRGCGWLPGAPGISVIAINCVRQRSYAARREGLGVSAPGRGKTRPLRGLTQKVHAADRRSAAR
jgi:hypothetical protein